MSLHTRETRRFISYKNGRRVVFGVVPVPVAIGLSALTAGVALAAVLLTTTVGGTLTVKTVGTANSVTVTGTADNGSALNCSDITVAADQASITLKPVLTKTVNGGNATSTDPVPGGDCTLIFSVKNNSTNGKSIKVDPDASKFDVLPKGIKVSGPGGEALKPIAPGETANLTVKLTAANEADGTGKFEGKLVYTDAA